MDEKGVFRKYDLSKSFLRKRRRLGQNPPYLKIGRMVKYRREDIEAFLVDHMVKTSDDEAEESN